jgi:hypothetical protein
MTAIELLIKIKNALETRGFCAYDTPHGEKSYSCETRSKVSMTKDKKAYFNKNDKGMHRLQGLTINIDVVYRNNGTDANKSVDATILNWENSSGKQIAKQRFNIDMSEKQINNRINKIVANWDEMSI